MAKKGSIKIETGSGTKEIPVFETNDVENSAWKVQTETGTGAIRLVDPSNADIPQIKVQTSNGVKSVATSLTLTTSISSSFALNNQNAKITVFEDTTGNGKADNTETVSLSSGTTSYDLSNLQGGENNEYWIQINFNNPEIEKTAEIQKITLETGENNLVESFEDGDVSEYSADSGNSGSTWEAVSESNLGFSAKQGSYVGHMYCNGTLDGWWADTNDLGAVPRGGDTISFWTRFNDNNGKVQLTYGRETTDSGSYGYSVYLEPATNEFGVSNIESGNTLGSTSHSYSANKWYYVEVDIGNDTDTHTARLYDSDGETKLEEVSGTDAGSFGEGIEWRWGWYNINGDAYFDHLDIRRN